MMSKTHAIRSPVVIVYPLVAHACPLVCAFVCPFAVLVCPLVVLAVLSVGLFITDRTLMQI